MAKIDNFEHFIEPRFPVPVSIEDFARFSVSTTALSLSLSLSLSLFPTARPPPSKPARGTRLSWPKHPQPQNVDNLSRAPPLNNLDSETRRTDVSLHVPLMTDPDAEQDLTVSATQRRSSRPERSSLCNDAREPSSSDSTSKRSKVSDKASSAKSISAPVITSNTFR